MSEEILRRWLRELINTAEYNRKHPDISADRYAAVMDVAVALEKALGWEPGKKQDA